MDLESGNIYVFNDVLDKNEFQFVTEHFESLNTKWSYGHNSYHGHNIKWFKCDLDNDSFFTEYLLKKITALTKTNWHLVRVYANGQTVMLDGGWHVDIDPENAEDCWTALLYVSDITPDNIDEINGHTEFKIKEEIKSIEPYKNRLIIFESGILHRGRAPSIPGMFRISVAWKLKKRE